MFLDHFFRFCNYFDTPYFFFLVIPAVWMSTSWRVGARFFYILMINGLINYVLKLIFQVPRPFLFAENLALVKLQEYSFPSGAAQVSMLIGLLLIYFKRTFWAKITAITYIIIIGISRIYLGVHYPLDILGGWAVGATIFWLFVQNYKKVDSLVRKNPENSFVLTLVACSIILYFADAKVASLTTPLLGLTIGLFTSFRLKILPSPPKNIIIKIVHSFATIFVLFLIFFSIKFLSPGLPLRFLTHLIGALWLSLIINFFIKKTSKSFSH